MWWRLVTAILILAVIVTAGILTLSYIDRTCADIKAHLDIAADEIQRLGRDDSPSLYQAHALWESTLPVLCTVVIHDQVDIVSEAFHRARGLYESETWDEYLAALGELSFRVDLVQHYDLPTIRSIF